jgi:hypothetical protein
MRTSFQTRKDGSMAIDADAEAARVIFASVLFAARFHDTITPLVSVAQKALDAAKGEPVKGGVKGYQWGGAKGSQ